jgi:hypothetical protein
MKPPLYPPREWFDDPQLSEPTPLTVERATGRVYGHIAPWSACHTGYPTRCVPPPRSAAAYAYFHTGQAETEEGETLAVGRITMRTGHAPLDLGAAEALAHYDHTGFCAAVVRAGEDTHGVWHAGAMLPHVSELDLAEMRRHPPSGDWRPIGRGLELVGTLCVNVPGYPVVRARVAAGAPGAVIQGWGGFREELDPDELIDAIAASSPALALRALARRIA